MKSMLRTVNDHGIEYEALMFVCPGCLDQDGGTGLHMLPVNTDKKSPAWTWDGNLETPTLSPSILTGKGSSKICHSFLRNGVFEFLSDCTHSMSDQKVPMVDLPDWMVNE